MPNINLTFNASGAVAGAKRGDVVVIVDLIDMSTSAEAALEAGAVAIFGAAPDDSRAPVNLDPENMGYQAGQVARGLQTELVLVAEPRYATLAQIRERITKALAGIERSGATIAAIVPNIGTEVVKMANFNNKVVLLLSDTGGVAFDAAYNNGAAAVLTATITRTPRRKGVEPARAGVKRALEAAQRYNCGITVTAASANSLEDVLAAEYLVKLLLENKPLVLPARGKRCH